MARRRRFELPESEFKHGERVVVLTAAGAEVSGVVEFIGWLIFPGCYLYEVRGDDGEKYGGSGVRIKAIRSDFALTGGE